MFVDFGEEFGGVKIFDGFFEELVAGKEDYDTVFGVLDDLGEDEAKFMVHVFIVSVFIGEVEFGVGSFGDDVGFGLVGFNDVGTGGGFDVIKFEFHGEGLDGREGARCEDERAGLLGEDGVHGLGGVEAEDVEFDVRAFVQDLDAELGGVLVVFVNFVEFIDFLYEIGPVF